MTLVHLSSEYVFDGRAAEPYREDAPVAPLSAYGASKAAGDLAVRSVPRHYLVRPTWVVGEGRNFVRTMLALAAKGVEPTVVDDQVGRPTFAPDIAAAIVHLLTTGAPYGTYHVTGSGEPASWAEVATATYALAGHGDLRVTPTSTADYFADRPEAARRPLHSVLDLTKARAAGVPLADWRGRLADYVSAARS
jgi:dTDP-4-dehydrorhamnose 3,5-epimerase